MRKWTRQIGSIALAAVMLFTGVGASQSEVKAASTGKLSVTGTQNYADAQEVLKEVNKYRKKYGRKALKMDKGLTNSAITRGLELCIYIPETSPHRRPNGKLSRTVNKKIIYEDCSESAGMTPKQIVKGWMDSPTHKKGILLSNAKSVGVAATTVVSPNGYDAQTWVLDFSASKAKKVEKSKSKKKVMKNIVTKNKYLNKKYFKLQTESRWMYFTTEKYKVMPTYQGAMMKKYGIYPTVINASSFKWSSSNPSVATVSSAGILTAKKPGKVTITVKLKTGTKVSFSQTIQIEDIDRYDHT